MSLRFGTDGVRGVAGRELTPELVTALGRAAVRVLIAPDSEKTQFLVGRDTRLSGPLLQAAFSAGVASEGADVVDLGVVPTPAVAALAAERGVPAAVISASHNPFADNGIKLLAPGGLKLSDAQESLVESLLASGLGAGPLLSGVGLGRLSVEASAWTAYADHVVSALEGRDLRGTRVVIDCANGAATTTAVSILEATGAELVQVLGHAPDGVNINEGCGSTDPAALAAAVVAHRADAGLAFDGDADRVIAVDDAGRVVDGDRLLALFARDLKSRGLLVDDTVVVTVMTNLGFHQAMDQSGISVHQTAVGDRYVLEALDDHGWSLGGEQSGHIIFRNLATTGDGVLSGILLLDLLSRSGRSLSHLAGAAMVRLPQVLRNVIVKDQAGLGGAQEIWDAVRDVEAKLGGAGRVLLRPSGTEKMVRVMVEAPTETVARSAVDRLVEVVSRSLG